LNENPFTTYGLPCHNDERQRYEAAFAAHFRGKEHPPVDDVLPDGVTLDALALRSDWATVGDELRSFFREYTGFRDHVDT